MDVIGGGVLVAVAAALWIAYLLPNWLRRRQYLATERNAVRLQQTLRILAETAETPEPVVVEATAREVATQQRILHEHEETARLAAEAAEQIAIAERREAEEVADAARARADAALAARAPVTEPIALPTSAPDSAGRAARLALRRKRAACSLTAFAALLTVIGGLVATVFGASLLIAGVAGIVFLASFGGLVALARVRPPRQASSVAQPVRTAAPEFEPIELPDTVAEPAGWTPQPLPRPLHLSRGTIAATAMASIEAAAELKRAESEAAVARRAERLAPPVPSITPAASAAAAAPDTRRADRPSAASPYASMGIVDDSRPGFEDLDAVLRRRRAAG
ncbi:hypothetical protein ACFVAJ_19405 [Agromyces sp. NPDC057679]|uniref:hypothetical protein n=1 Tax=Agromyces sp. NPDC057679 TaxID=3346207 RepID=UPI003671075D